MQKTAKLESLTDTGRRRSNNEDVALTGVLPDGYTLLAVADGVGGTRGGEVASAKAVGALSGHLKAAEIGDPQEALRGAFQGANAKVRQVASERPDLMGMSTTLVAGLVRGHEAWIATVGDSRAYLIESGRAHQLTEDHSLAAERIKAGLHSDDDANNGYGRNIITRSVGIEKEVNVDLFGPMKLPAGSALLLCSDGLHGVVSDDQIACAFAYENVAERLIELANDAGGPDNIAVALLHMAA